MNRFLFLLTILFFSTYLFAQPAGYYDAATGTGYALKTQLHYIIDGHNSQTYDALWTHFQVTEVDNYYENDGSPLDMYSENPDGTDPYNWTFVSDQCGNYSGEGSCYNREHSFPKSWFNDGYPMYTDLFHLYLTDGYVNGQRGNFPFGEVGTASWTSQNGSKKGASSYPGYTGTVFEPIDEFKGDFARTYFYMATRYENVVSGWSSPMLDGSTNQVYEDWALSMLLEWHANDPVSLKERDRNDAVYGIQDNRNPFIDHPEWVNSIWGGGTENPEPDNQPTSFTATLNGVNQIDLSWIDATGTNLPTGYLIKANTTGSFTPPADGTDPSEDSNLADGNALVKVAYGNESYTFSGLNSETTYYFKVWAYANMGATIDFKLDGTVPTDNATTLVAPVVINSEDFSSCPGTWTSVSVAGSADWTCDATYLYAGINAYGADVASDDYLISPEINLDAYSNEVFSFESWTKYNDTYYPPIELLYTTNYTGDPSTTTWQTLSPTWAAENSEIWTASGDVSLSGISGASVYLAFRYTSSGTGGGSSSIWDIDNIFLTGYESGPNLAVSPSSLTDFTYEENSGPSASQSFTLSGSELDGSSITITAPGNYELSLDNSTFTTTETVSYTAPTLGNTSVYVRLKAGLTAGIYNSENVICADNGSAASVTVSNNGEVTAALNPVLTVSPTTLNGFTYEENSGPSASQSFELSGSDLDGSSITLTAPVNYELSLDNSAFTTTETISYAAPTLGNTSVYVRLKAGLTAGTYNSENVTCADNGSAASVTVSNNGEVTTALDPVPDNYPTDFVVSAFDDTQMDLTWTDATGTNLPTGYLLKASTNNQLDDPVNGIEPDEDSDLSDGEALILLPYGTITHSFEGLSESTTYYFKMWPFANTGNAIIFKTDGAVPAASATTEGTGIMNKSGLETELLVFPNPAGNQLFIELIGSSFVQIYTMQGVLEYEQQMQNSAEIDVRGFNKGLYLLKVQGIDTDWQRLIVIE
ncbi:MAG: endonuclease [Salinivirgaceae bacterium]|jgi:endonuclease I|nr:endonuclease [Salinivirgaceae bacterium]